MKTREFLHEKIYFLFIAFLTNLITIVFLFAIQVNSEVIIIISLLHWGMVLSVLVIEFLRRYTFYKRLQQTLDGLDKKYLLTEVIDEPLFMDGKILYETLRITNKSMADHVNEYRIIQNEYKDYIEMWVHEIKTPLAASKLILSNNPCEVSDSIQEEIEKVENFVEQALFYARSTNPEKDYLIKELNLQSAVSKVIRKHSKTFIYQKIKVELHDVDHMIYSDSKWLDFILNQIISNALKYMPKDTGILHVWAEDKEDMIKLYIQDNGCGIEPSEIGRIFDKGFTGTNGRNHEKATGMGLYLCKTLCDKLYLGIEAESVLDQGTTIILSFPISKLMLLK